MSPTAPWARGLAAAALAASLAGPAAAMELLNTGSPFAYGYDVFAGQSVAISFTPNQDYSFDSVSLWLMSNSSQPGATLTISLQTDLGGGAVPSIPSGNVLESWAHATATVGWQPALETIQSASRPLLHGGTSYWIVAESSLVTDNAIWVVAGNGDSYTIANINSLSGPGWQSWQTTGALGTIVMATPVPEPKTMLLLAVGVPLALLAVRRRSAPSSDRVDC